MKELRNINKRLCVTKNDSLPTAKMWSHCSFGLLAKIKCKTCGCDWREPGERWYWTWLLLGCLQPPEAWKGREFSQTYDKWQCVENIWWHDHTWKSGIGRARDQEPARREIGSYRSTQNQQSGGKWVNWGLLGQVGCIQSGLDQLDHSGPRE